MTTDFSLRNLIRQSLQSARKEQKLLPSQPKIALTTAQSKFFLSNLSSWCYEILKKKRYFATTLI